MILAYKADVAASKSALTDLKEAKAFLFSVSHPLSKCTTTSAAVHISLFKCVFDFLP